MGIAVTRRRFPPRKVILNGVLSSGYLLVSNPVQNLRRTESEYRHKFFIVTMYNLIDSEWIVKLVVNRFSLVRRGVLLLCAIYRRLQSLKYFVQRACPIANEPSATRKWIISPWHRAGDRSCALPAPYNIDGLVITWNACRLLLCHYNWNWC